MSEQMTDNLRSEYLTDDGTFPNNERLPVLIYEGAFDRGAADNLASEMEAAFRKYGWGGMWRNGIYDYHHYHSTAHEVLGIAGGTAQVQLGGPDGIVVDVKPGDVLVLPAGVAHKNLGASSDFLVVGAYPKGQDYDMNVGRDGERPQADQNIDATPLPNSDPVRGPDGPLMKEWKR